MIGKISQGVYYIKGDYNVYLIIDRSNGILINSSDGEDSNLIIEGIEEILSNYNVDTIKYLILTDHYEESSGGASYIASFFGTPFIISSSEEAIFIRKGTGKNKKYNPVSINLEIKNKITDIENLRIIKANSPSLGSLIVMYNNTIFSGANKVSGIIGKINYICNVYECKKVEELWYLKSYVNRVGDSQKQNTVK
mgnify:CR=1 FL=1